MTFKYKGILLFIILLGLVLRLQGLSQSLWLDEAIQTLAVKNNSLFDLITKYSLGDFHTPLYHVVLKLWTNIFGYSEISVRLPSVIFNSLTTLFVFLIAKKLKNVKVGLIAALFWTLNPLAIYYAQEARMYSLAAFGVATAMWFFLEKKWLGFIVFFAIALYSDYLPFLMFPVFFFLSDNKKHFLFLTFILSLLFIPWLPFFWQQFHIGTSFAQAAPGWGEVVGAGSLKSIPLAFIKFTVGRITLENKFLYATLFGGSVLFCFYLILRAGKQKIPWTWLLVPLVLGFVISFKISIFSYFRFLFILPVYCLLLATGTREKTWAILGVVVIFTASTFAFKLNPEFQRENWRAVAGFISKDPGQVAMPSIAQNAPLKYYLPTQVVEDKSNFKPTAKTFYLIRYVQEIFDPTDSLRLSLEESGYSKEKEVGFNGVLVWKYKSIIH